MLQWVLYALGIAAAIAVGRASLKKQTIQDQAAFIEILEKDRLHMKETIDELRIQNTQQEKRIQFLEKMIYGDPSLVYPSNIPSPRRPRRGNRPDSPEAPKDR